MAYRTGPYQDFVELPVPPRPVLCSARKIDAPTADFVFNGTTGGFESMPSTAQRVLLLVAWADTNERFITPQDLESHRQAIVASLDVMTRGPSPAIKLLEVKCDPYLPENCKTTVRYRDLTTGLDQEIQV